MPWGNFKPRDRIKEGLQMSETQTIRTEEEVLAKFLEVKEEDFFGFKTNDLLERLPFKFIKQYLKEDATEEKWEEVRQPLTRESILKAMEEYMPFAWEKANNCRGLSAGRSMAHFMMWTWLLCDDFGDLEEYEYYGKDNLVKLCEFYGWDHTQWDDGIRSNTEY